MLNNNQSTKKIDELSVDALRMLSVEAIEKANSGHPGLPLGCAPITYALFSKFLKFNPKDTKWQDRDRFILSAGHGSSLYYALLHLFGYDITIEDIQNFRQLGSKTAGHPEYKHTPGIETTTGPLGQGIANAVGFALAESHLAAIFNREKYTIVDHYTYVLCGDGCLQEGISYEACSFAGTQKLGKLILLYDDNGITIEGETKVTFTEDIVKRFHAQGWQVILVPDANDLQTLTKAIHTAKKNTEKPSLIICKSTIGYGSPLAGSEESHGAPLGRENVIQLKNTLSWKHDAFILPEEVKQHCLAIGRKGIVLQGKWKKLFEEYSIAYPKLAALYKQYMENESVDLSDLIKTLTFDKPEATRNSSSTILNIIAQRQPNMIGGSADLGSSNKSIMQKFDYISSENRMGKNIHFGVREHAMAAITNGLYLHGGLRSYCATFFVFSDYMKNAMRLSALMKLPVIYILTHDSIGVGEDGPTHQPIEQLIALRSIPNMQVFRPCDGKETIAGWILAMQSDRPTALILSRQNLPQFQNSGLNALKGGYILADSIKAVPDAILISCGSEIAPCMQAKQQLQKQGIDVRVVSMPSIEVFERQSSSYKEAVLPSTVTARVCVEAASSYSWHRYAGLKGEIIAIDTFGTSGPAHKLFAYFGFTPENIIEKVYKAMNK